MRRGGHQFNVQSRRKNIGGGGVKKAPGGAKNPIRGAKSLYGAPKKVATFFVGRQ